MESLPVDPCRSELGPGEDERVDVFEVAAEELPTVAAVCWFGVSRPTWHRQTT